MTKLRNYICRLKKLSTVQGQRGLTLIEIIIVLAILAIVVGWLSKKVFTGANLAKASLTESKMQSLKGPLYLYQLKNNALPNNLNAANIDAEDSNDGWGAPLQYRVLDGGRSYELRSLGADGKEGGSGADADIVKTGP